MSELMYRAQLRAARDIMRVTRRPFRALLNPFETPRDQRPALIHCCYHKVGTVWFGRILRHVAAHFGLSFVSATRLTTIRAYESGTVRPDVLLDLGSHVDISLLDRYRASHMVRDPRDLIVSAYFYHKWTEEKWANVPDPQYEGMSYKAWLNRMPKDEGLMLEMEKSKFWIEHMADWAFGNPCVFEIKYEELIADEERIFHSLFRHYGFTENAARKACGIARRYSFNEFKKKRQPGEVSHLRSGLTQEWRSHFTDDHIARFKSLYPGIVSKLGYESNEEWR